MKADIAVPVSQCAFDDPGTRRAYQRSRRLTVLSLFIRVGVWIALLVVAKMVETDAQFIEGAASFLSIPTAFLLIAPARRLRWMSVVKDLLKASPWRRCRVSAYEAPKTGLGTVVQVEVMDSDGSSVGAPSVMAGRTWRMRKPWSRTLVGEGWFAGQMDRGGVVARPGGRLVAVLRMTEAEKVLSRA